MDEQSFKLALDKVQGDECAQDRLHLRRRRDNICSGEIRYMREWIKRRFRVYVGAEEEVG